MAKTKETLDNGFIVEKVTGEEMEKLKKNYFYYTDGVVRFEPGHWTFPPSITKFINLAYNFKVKPTDIYVVAIPKSGINWVQEIVWNLMFNPDLDNPDANITIDARCPFYELDFLFEITGAPFRDPEGDIMKKFRQLCPDKDPSEGVFINLAAHAPDPRLIKNHLPCSMLPPDMFKTSKVIYIARDPRDVMLSFYHFSKLHVLAGFRGTMEESIDDYINSRIPYDNYFEHVRSGWERRNDPNFLFLYYEDMKADTKAQVRRINEFIGTKRTDKQMDNIVKFTEFSNMKERTKDNPPTSFDRNYFNKDEEKKGATYYRKGKVGSWKEEFTPELKEKINAWMTKNLPSFGEEFKYKV